MPPCLHNGIFARDVSVLRIHSQGPVMCARVLRLRVQRYKPATNTRARIHAFSLNKMEPYQLDKLLPVKPDTKSLSQEDRLEGHRSSTVWYSCFIWQHANYVYLTPMQLCLAFYESPHPANHRIRHCVQTLSLILLVCHNVHGGPVSCLDFCFR